MQTITNTRGDVIYTSPGAETIRDAVEESVRNKTSLHCADLRGAYLGCADLRGADLHCADLRGADLRGAVLRGADLGGAELRGADLRVADLRGAVLRGADLGGADLGGADLRGANLNWQSHDLLAEILRQAAERDTEKLKIAGFVLISREKCWVDFLEIAESETLGGWALDVLAEFTTGVNRDVAPGCLRKRNESNHETIE